MKRILKADEQAKWYNAGVAEGKKHSQPSPETMEFMRQTTKNMSEFSIEIRDIKEKLEKIPNRDEMKLAVKEGVEEALELSDEKYAVKATEKRVGDIESNLSRVVWIILAIIIASVLALIIRADVNISLL